MRSRTALVLVVFALALLAAVWRWRQPTGARKHADVAGERGAGGGRAGDARSTSVDLPPPAWFAAEGVKPRRLAGRVLLDGKPATNATVSLHSELTRTGRARSLEVAAGADGRFDLGLWAAGKYTVAAIAPGVRGAIQEIDLANPLLKSDALELRLRTCVARIDGTITDASGAPIEDATVADKSVTLARADAKGAYSVCVPFGQVNLEYAADGYGAVVLGFNVVSSTSQDVVLVPAATIAGHVIRADDGSPVTDARVNVYPQEWGRDRPASRSAISDASGAFRIEGLTPARYRAWASAEGLSSEGPSAVEAQLGVTNEVVVKLVPRSRIRGIVRLGGKPLPGVTVVAVRGVPSSRSSPAFTQADGRFVLDDVPIGDLVFSVDGYDVTAPTSYRTELGKAHEGLVIEVAAMATIRGVVTRKDVPVEGAGVCCVNGRENGRAQEFTDAAGRYELAGLPPGKYYIGAGSEDVGAFTLGKDIVVAAGEVKTADFELDLAAEILGTVVDAHGKPVKGVFVRFTHVTTQDEGRSATDAAGGFHCRAMQGGGIYKAKVFATPASQRAFPPAPGSEYPSIDVKDGTSRIEGVTIAIDRQELSISGLVVDSAGAPVVDAQVKASASDGSEPVFDSWRRLPMTATDADGRFTLGGLVPGSYAVQARSADGGEAIAAAVEAGASGVRLVLTRPGSIEGTLVGYTRPAVVYATPWNAPHKLLPGAVDGATFRIPGVKPGRYLVNAQNAIEGDAQLVEVRAGVKAIVTMTAGGHGVVEGKVLDWRTREPLAGAACHVVTSVDGQQGLTNWDLVSASKSDASGRVIVDPSPAGDVTITCEMRQPRTSTPSADLVLAAGGRASVELYTVKLSVENPGTTGIEFLWTVTPPRIWSVAPKSPAARAGLMAGDLVIAVDGAPVTGLNGPGVQFLILDHAIGTKVNVTVQRGAQKKTVELVVEAAS